MTDKSKDFYLNTKDRLRIAFQMLVEAKEESEEVEDEVSKILANLVKIFDKISD